MPYSDMTDEQREYRKEYMRNYMREKRAKDKGLSPDDSSNSPTRSYTKKSSDTPIVNTPTNKEAPNQDSIFTTAMKIGIFAIVVLLYVAYLRANPTQLTPTNNQFSY